MIDPEMRALLDELSASGYGLGRLRLAEERVSFRQLFQRLGGTVATDVGVEELTVGGAAGPLAARLYRPKTEDGLTGPALVYFHGGGGVLGDLDAYDAPCSRIAGLSSVPLIAIDYRLAPEHPFPAGYDDAEAAAGWVYDNAAALRLDPDRIGIGGDSQGGSMAAMAALRLASRRFIAFQLLIYPGLGIDIASLDLLEGHFLDRQAITFFRAHNGMADHPEAAARSPVGHALRDAPPAYIATAEFDALSRSALSYATSLRAAGVPATSREFPGLIHGFLNMAGVSGAADAALVEIAAAVRTALAKPVGTTEKRTDAQD